MENGKRTVYRPGCAGYRIIPFDKYRRGKHQPRKERFRRQYLVPAVLPHLLISVASFFLEDTLVQLTPALAMDSRIEPVDTKVTRDIVPVSIKLRDNDHLAEALQHHRKQHDSDDQLSKTQYDHGISEHAAQN